MAKFEDWINSSRRHRRIYGEPPNYVTYQNLYNDAGNWTGGAVGSGEQIGTNRSISAPALGAYLGRTATLAEMQNLSVATALAIYKKDFWDKIKGDEINSQLIANLLADMKSSAGGNGVKALQRALNGIGYGVTVDGVIGNESIKAINNALIAGRAQSLYNAFRSQMIAFYQNVNIFGNQLIRSLNEDYPANAKVDVISTGAGAMGVLALAAFAFYKLRKR